MKKFLILLSLLLVFVACDNDTVSEEKKDEENTQVEEDNSNNPEATIVFEDGSKVVIRLYPDKAPNTVNNFIALANDGFYDGLTFHRIISGFMIQGGDPQGSGIGGPGYAIKGEMANNGFEQNDLENNIGSIAMARSSAYDSAGSQFYINVANNDFLNDEYAVFGDVIDNYNYIRELSKVETDDSDKPLEDVVIKTITIDDKGEKYDEPEKIEE